MIRALGLGALVACAACASANVGGGDGDAGVTDDGATPSDGKVQADGQRDGPLQDDGGGGQDDGGSACTPDDDEGFGNNTCAEAVTKGSLSDASSSHLSIVANLWPAGDVDWYRVAFEDTADTPGVCDKLNIRISFAQNPGDRYLFDVMADDCTGTPTCDPGEQPTGLTTFSYTDAAECPCVEAATPSATTATTHVCVDHSMVLRIRVYRVVGAEALCESYELSIDNG